MIHGIGIDIVSIARFERALKKWGARLERRVFTDTELAYCNGKKRPAVHLAARFAAKEAAFKALGAPVAFRNIEVKSDGGSRPTLNVAGLGEGYLFHLSISHEKEFAVASVMVERE